MSNQQGRERLSQQAVTKEEQQRPMRKSERVSMAQGVNLDVEVKEGYIGRWASASWEGRIERLKAAGYEFALDAEGNQIKRSKGGSDLVLMIIPKEFWDEDFEAGQAKIDQQVNAQQRLGKDEYTPDGRAVLSRDSVI